jgi:hypothetical protein
MRAAFSNHVQPKRKRAVAAARVRTRNPYVFLSCCIMRLIRSNRYKQMRLATEAGCHARRQFSPRASRVARRTERCGIQLFSFSSQTSLRQVASAGTALLTGCQPSAAAKALARRVAGMTQLASVVRQMRHPLRDGALLILCDELLRRFAPVIQVLPPFFHFGIRFLDHVGVFFRNVFLQIAHVFTHRGNVY